MCFNIFKPKPPIVPTMDLTNYTLVFDNGDFAYTEHYGDATGTLVKDPGNEFIIWGKPETVKKENGYIVLLNDLNNIPGEPSIKAGEIATYKSCLRVYGYYEVVCKVPPKGIDNWFCLWLEPMSWDFEIDFAEFMSKDSSEYIVTIHQRVNGVMQIMAQKVIQPGIDLSIDFHVYGCDWQANYIRCYLDNKQVFEYLGATPAIPMYLVCDIAVRPGYQAAEGILTFPNEALIKSVKIYSKN